MNKNKIIALFLFLIIILPTGFALGIEEIIISEEKSGNVEGFARDNKIETFENEIYIKENSENIEIREETLNEFILNESTSVESIFLNQHIKKQKFLDRIIKKFKEIIN